MTGSFVGEFYQFVLAAVYHADGLWGDATCDVYLRDLPEDMGYAICAGTEDAVEAALGLGFDEDTVAWLEDHPSFAHVSPTFFESLRHLRFTGEVHAIPEGSVVFPFEPILRVTAPLIQCVLLETRLLQRVGFAVGVASRAARIVDAAAGREVIDFSSRRWSSDETARVAARAAYVGGVTATGNLDAARRYGIEPRATLSGFAVAVYQEERRAIEALRGLFPDAVQIVLPEEDPRTALARFRGVAGPGAFLRLPGANLGRLARTCREALDASGLKDVRILGSGGLDEYRIGEMVAAGTPVDAFAVASALGDRVSDVSGQVSFRVAEMMRGATLEPVLGICAAHWPGRKQVVRYPHKDVLCLDGESESLARRGGVPLLQAVASEGRRVVPSAPLVVARGLRAAGVSILPRSVRRLEGPARWLVEPSDRLARLALG